MYDQLDKIVDIFPLLPLVNLPEDKWYKALAYHLAWLWSVKLLLSQIGCCKSG